MLDVFTNLKTHMIAVNDVFIRMNSELFFTLHHMDTSCGKEKK